MNPTKAKIAVVAACIVLIVVLGSMGGSSKPASSASGSTAGAASTETLDAIKIVSDLPLQGSSRAQTETMVQAIQMKLAEINSKAGGVSIEYVSKDDSTAQAGKWDEARCTQNMTEAVSDPSVVVLIGPFNSGCAQVQIGIANRGGLAMVSPANTAVGLTKAGGDPGEPDKYYPTGARNYLRVALADDLQGKAGAAWAQELGVKRVFVLHDKETYGKGIADQFKAAAEKLGIEVTGFEGIDPMATNYRGLVPKIQSTKSQLVYFGGITQNNAGQLVKDIRSADSSIKFMGPDGIYEEAFVEAAGKWADGALATFGGLPPDQLTGKGKEFVASFRKEYGEPQAYTAYAYDAIGVAVDAIERCGKAGGVSRACVIEQLFQTTDYSGALGTFSMTDTGDTTLTVLSGVKVKKGVWSFDRKIDVGAVQ